MRGYVKNKKGMAVSRSSSRDPSLVRDYTYIINTARDPLGTRGIVEIWAKQPLATQYTQVTNVIHNVPFTSPGSPQSLSALYPVIPYRFMLGEINAAKWSLLPDATPPYGSWTNVLNPGLDQFNLEAYNIGSVNQPYIEVNLTRDQVSRLVNNYATSSYAWCGQSTTKKTVGNDIKLDDINLGISVYQQSDVIDYLAISVVTRITLTGITYTVPCVILYKITKSLTSVACDFISWTFGVPSNHINDLTCGGQINSAQPDGGPALEMWNYNFIGGQNYNGGQGSPRDLYPCDLGTLVDSHINSSRILIASFISSWDASLRRWQALRAVFPMNLSSTYVGFYAPSDPVYWSNYAIPAQGGLSLPATQSDLVPLSLKCIQFPTANYQVIAFCFADYTILVFMQWISVIREISVKYMSDVDIEAYGTGFAISYMSYRTAPNPSRVSVINTGSNATLFTRIPTQPVAQLVDNLCSYLSFSPIVTYSAAMPTEMIYTVKIMKTSAGPSATQPFWPLSTSININDNSYTVYSASENPYLKETNGSIYLHIINGTIPVISLIQGVTVSTANAGGFVSSFGNIIICPNNSVIYSVLRTYENTVYDYNNSDIRIGAAVSPTGNFSYVGLVGGQVDVILDIPNSYGVFRSNVSIPGVNPGDVPKWSIDYFKTRVDFSFDLFSNPAGYGAMIGTSPTCSVDIWNDNNNTKIGHSSSLGFIGYDTGGNSDIQSRMTLDLSNSPGVGGKSFSDVGYTLSNIRAVVTIDNPEKTSLTLTGLKFIPPNVAVAISVSSTRVINSSVVAIATKSNSTSTINNLVLHEFTSDGSESSPDTTSLTPFKLRINGPTFTSGNFPFTLTNYSKGDYFYIDWDENAGRLLTNKTPHISVVTDHIYSISSVSIFINGVNDTVAIAEASTPFTVVTPNAPQAVVAATFTTSHEVWPPIADMIDVNRYPNLKSATMVVVPKQVWPDIPAYNNGASPPYPNGTAAFAQYLIDTTLAWSTDNVVTATYATGIITKTQTLTANVKKTKEYQIFLIIKDEFDQVSVYHLTSTDKSDNQFTYRTEFGQT